MSSAVNAAAPHAILRGLFTILAIGLLVGGLIMIFSTQTWYPLILPDTPATPAVSVLVKGIGAIVLGLSYLALAVSRDPVRYRAVVDAVILVLIFVVIIEIYEIAARGADAIYPNHLLLLSTIFRAVLAGVLIGLRPREAYTAST
ncbi:MAG TPA: hypothetical protein VFF60_05640 [Candidatus Binatus sp.]|nr:hypothetical protein [Candidatus Binatus sp.]